MIMKSLAGLFLCLLTCTSAITAQALEINTYLPYPPACGEIPDPMAAGGIEARAVKFYDQVHSFYSSQGGEQVPLRLRLYRAPCSEPDRSLVWVEFVLAAQYASQDRSIELPTAAVETAPNTSTLMNLASGPNNRGANGWVDREGLLLESKLQGLRWYYGDPPGERRWVFLLDNGPSSPELGFHVGLTAAEYNAAFKLVLRYNPYDFLTIEVPATAQLLPATGYELPLSGRLSGNWVIPGTADQGILLSISELVLPDPGINDVSPDMPMVIFLAHFTFDSQGRMLWLTGSANLGPGQTQVTIPIEFVAGGEFRGSKRAERTVVGSVTLRSRSCNDLDFVFDYSGVGLGSGETKLKRLFSMEIAGHECQDQAARLAANQ